MIRIHVDPTPASRIPRRSAGPALRAVHRTHRLVDHDPLEHRDRCTHPHRQPKEPGHDLWRKDTPATD